jgi:hypothetical protein
MENAVSVNDYRLFGALELAEPYAGWQALRDTSPVHVVSEGIGYTIVTRYADVVTALRHPESFSNKLSRRFPSGMSPHVFSEEVQNVLAEGCPYVDALAFTDGERHARHRRMVRSGFSTRRVRELDAIIFQSISDLFDEIPMNTEVDLWSKLCIPLPVRVIGHILGVDQEHSEDIKRWADAQVARYGEPLATEADNLRIARDFVDFHQYLYAALAARRAQPQDDFLSDLVHASSGISEDELVMVCAQLLVAGAESSASLMGSVLDYLADRPAEVQRLRADPSLIPGVVEETLRAESPVKLVYRITTRDVELGGTVIPADSVVILMLGSANRDERTFAEAEVLDPDREEARRHLAFGFGLHLCPGAELTRTEGRMMLENLLRRTSRITRARDHVPARPPHLTIRAFADLRLVLEPAAAALDNICPARTAGGDR